MGKYFNKEAQGMGMVGTAAKLIAGKPSTSGVGSGASAASATASNMPPTMPRSPIPSTGVLKVKPAASDGTAVVKQGNYIPSRKYFNKEAGIWDWGLRAVPKVVNWGKNLLGFGSKAVAAEAPVIAQGSKFILPAASTKALPAASSTITSLARVPASSVPAVIEGGASTFGKYGPGMVNGSFEVLPNAVNTAVNVASKGSKFLNVAKSIGANMAGGAAMTLGMNMIGGGQELPPGYALDASGNVMQLPPMATGHTPAQNKTTSPSTGSQKTSPSTQTSGTGGKQSYEDWFKTQIAKGGDARDNAIKKNFGVSDINQLSDKQKKILDIYSTGNAGTTKKTEDKKPMNLSQLQTSDQTKQEVKKVVELPPQQTQPTTIAVTTPPQRNTMQWGNGNVTWTPQNTDQKVDPNFVVTTQ